MNMKRTLLTIAFLTMATGHAFAYGGTTYGGGTNAVLYSASTGAAATTMPAGTHTMAQTDSPPLTGNVGINTPSASYPLDITGSAGWDQLRLTSSGTNRSGLILNNAAGGQIDEIIFDNAGTALWSLNKNTANSLNI